MQAVRPTHCKGMPAHTGGDWAPDPTGQVHTAHRVPPGQLVPLPKLRQRVSSGLAHTSQLPYAVNDKIKQRRSINNNVIGLIRLTLANLAFSIASVEGSKPTAGRPHVKVKFQGTTVTALVDSGASISCVSEKFFNTIWNSWEMRRLALPRHIRVSGITGHAIKIVDYVEVDIEMQGKTISRPVLVVSGLDHMDVVIGYDTITAEGLVIDGQSDQVYFKKHEDKVDAVWSMASLVTRRRVTLQPRTTHLVRLTPITGTKTLPVGTEGLCVLREKETLGMADECLVKVSELGEVRIPISNYSDKEVHLLPGDIMAGMRNMEAHGEVAEPITDAFIHSMLGDIKPDPKEPKRGCIRSMTPAEQAKLLNEVNLKAPQEFTQRYKRLICDYNDVLSKDKFDLGHTDIIEHKIKLQDETPVHVRQFRIPFGHEQLIKDHVRELLKQGAIEESRSPYNSPIFGVAKPPNANSSKPGGPELRVVLDYRALNNASLPDRYSMKEVMECIDEVGRDKSVVFSALDLTAGFWQQALEEQSRQYTAFSVPGMMARYQWRVTPMGLQGSPASFGRLMDHVMREVKGLCTYIDDVLCHTRTHEQHLQQLEEAFLRLRKYGLKLNVGKTIFGASRLQYLGYTLSGAGVTVSDLKVTALKECKDLLTPLNVRRFVGMCNYFRFLIKDFSLKTAPLTKLISTQASWAGGPLPKEEKACFERLRDELISSPVMAFPRRDLPFTLTTDASLGDDNTRGGLGAVLTQKHPDGTTRVISYASRQLKTHEKNYSAYLLEHAAACFGIEYYGVYLYGSRFTLRCDHRPLEKLSTVHKRTLCRLQELMLTYDFNMIYTPGTDIPVSDFLSRNVPDNSQLEIAAIKFSLGTTSEEIMTAQKQDTKLKLMHTYLTNSTLPADKKLASWVLRCSESCFLDKDGVVWYRSKRPGFRPKDLIIPPEKFQQELIRAAHSTREAGHGGETRTTNRLLSCYWWPGLTQQVKTFVQLCERCQLGKSVPPPPSRIKSIAIDDQPNVRVHLDLMTNLRVASRNGHKVILVMTDAFTKYAEVIALENKEANTVARAFFEKWICRFSSPVHDHLGPGEGVRLQGPQGDLQPVGRGENPHLSLQAADKLGGRIV